MSFITSKQNQSIRDIQNNRLTKLGIEYSYVKKHPMPQLLKDKYSNVSAFEAEIATINSDSGFQILNNLEDTNMYNDNNASLTLDILRKNLNITDLKIYIDSILNQLCLFISRHQNISKSKDGITEQIVSEYEYISRIIGTFMTFPESILSKVTNLRNSKSEIIKQYARQLAINQNILLDIADLLKNYSASTINYLKSDMIFRYNFLQLQELARTTNNIILVDGQNTIFNSKVDDKDSVLTEMNKVFGSTIDYPFDDKKLESLINNLGQVMGKNVQDAQIIILYHGTRSQIVGGTIEKSFIEHNPEYANVHYICVNCDPCETDDFLLILLKNYFTNVGKTVNVLSRDNYLWYVIHNENDKLNYILPKVLQDQTLTFTEQNMPLGSKYGDEFSILISPHYRDAALYNMLYNEYTKNDLNQLNKLIENINTLDKNIEVFQNAEKNKQKFILKYKEISIVGLNNFVIENKKLKIEVEKDIKSLKEKIEHLKKFTEIGEITFEDYKESQTLHSLIYKIFEKKIDKIVGIVSQFSKTSSSVKKFSTTSMKSKKLTSKASPTKLRGKTPQIKSITTVKAATSSVKSSAKPMQYGGVKSKKSKPLKQSFKKGVKKSNKRKTLKHRK